MNVAVIINPMAGRDEPILRTLNSFFQHNPTIWQPYITQREGHTTELVAQALTTHPDVIVVYGGDGTVMEAAQALIGNQTPLLVLPGGTANVVAKEFLIPHDISQALQLLDSGKTIPVDTYKLNEQRGFIRVNHGILANAIILATPERKQALGTLAYTLSSIKNLLAIKPTPYNITVDGNNFETSGIGLSITNLASVGFSSLKFHTAVTPHDGLLDLIVVKHVDAEVIPNLFNSVVWAGDEQSVDHFQGKSITVYLPNEEPILIDDYVHQTNVINTTVAHKPLHIIVPSTYDLHH